MSCFLNACLFTRFHPTTRVHIRIATLRLRSRFLLPGLSEDRPGCPDCRFCALPCSHLSLLLPLALFAPSYLWSLSPICYRSISTTRDDRGRHVSRNRGRVKGPPGQGRNFAATVSFAGLRRWSGICRRGDSGLSILTKMTRVSTERSCGTLGP